MTFRVFPRKEPFRWCIKLYIQPLTIVPAEHEEILGQTFKGDGMTFTVAEPFYKGVLAEEEFILDNIGQFTILNIVGNRIVELALREGLISGARILTIGEVKHAQAVRM